MSTGSVLLLVAAIVGAEGGVARIDQGSSQGIELGDQGQVFYELTVNGFPKRIEVGSARVLEVSESTASVQAAPGTELRPGFEIEFRLPTSRMIEMPPEERSSEPVPPVEAAGPVPAEERSSEPDVGEGLAPSRSPDATSGPAPLPPPRTTVLIPAGRYSIGRDLPTAEFHNQTPRFEIETRATQIDRRPVTVVQYSRVGHSPLGASKRTDYVRAVTWFEAEAYCRSLGARLPSELEWEIAVQIPDVESPSGLLEWTGSWYSPYPGNAHPEEQYGETYRTLRGGPAGAAFDPHARRFMAPEQNNASVGFRCANLEGAR